MSSQPAILHVDGDDFFASMARLKAPRLRGRPVVVGNLQSRGYVVAASYEARASGIHGGITMAQAERMCPGGALVQVDWNLARKASAALFGLLGRYSPRVERSALDALFVDYTGCGMLFGPPADFARRLQREIRDELNLSVSVGLAADKAVSAVACRAAKLGNFREVRPGCEMRFLMHCPVEWLPGMTPGLSDRFRRMGIRNIGHLAGIPEGILVHLYGSLGAVLWKRARGVEGGRVRPRGRPEEPCVREIFPSDILDAGILESRLAHLAGRLGNELRRRQRSAQHVLLRILYADGVLVQRQAALPLPSHRDPELFRAARVLFGQLYYRRVRVRSLALVARNIRYCPSELPLGDAARRAKWDRVLRAVDSTRTRFPDPNVSVRLAAALG
ncbi:hypothetical protein JXA40_06815 [bacterium]|nr:hypothetical protein [candidate division CSSED10-310 bacterium]